MCLYIKSGCKIEIADRSILCKKIIIPGINNLTSCIMGLDFNYDEELQATDHLRESKHIYHGIIFRGFHAYLDNEELIKDRINTFSKIIGKSSLVSVQAIIPQGAEYCYGVNDEIVSNRIIIKR